MIFGCYGNGLFSIFFFSPISFHHCLHMENGGLFIQLSWFCRSFTLAHCFFTVHSFRMHPFTPKNFINVPHSNIFIRFHLLMRVPVFFSGLIFPLKIVLHWICAWSINSFGYYIKQMAGTKKSEFSSKNVQSQMRIMYVSLWWQQW